MGVDELMDEFFPPEEPAGDDRALPPIPVLEPGMYDDVSHDRYHADPCTNDDGDGSPSLSSSIAGILATKAPLHGWWSHPRLGGGASRFSDPTDRGTVIHRMLLGRGQDYVEVEADSFRTNRAKAERDGARSLGKIPLLSRDLDEYTRVADIYRRRLLALDEPVEFKGATELTLVWIDDGVLCRCRLDHLNGDQLIIDDVKTCRSTAPKEIARSMAVYRTDVQNAAYIRAIEHLVPGARGKARMRFHYLEAEAPYDVVTVELGGEDAEFGVRRWTRGRDIWKTNLAAYGKKEWPGTSKQVIRLPLPAWAKNDEADAQLAAFQPSREVDF